jgi:hypothetical protein
MAPALETLVLKPEEAAPAARAPLTDWQRRCILIAAAATAALGAPVRVVDIRPVKDPADQWKRKTRTASRMPRRTPWLRKQTSAFAPELEVREGDHV